MSCPLAYHITFGTYGTRLHGDPRGTVDHHQNKPGDPIIGRDGDWMRLETQLLSHPPIRLSLEQRCKVERALPAVCERGGWTLHIAAARVDHVHVMLSTTRDGEAVRRWLKRWLGETLSDTWPLAEGAHWWAKGGSVRLIWDQAYFANVFHYIEAQRTSS